MLAAAALFMSGWIRSLAVNDLILIHFGNGYGTHSVVSSGARLTFITKGPPLGDLGGDRLIWGFDSWGPPLGPVVADPFLESGSPYPDGYLSMVLHTQYAKWWHGFYISYSLVTIPLTLLAAYLILWTPRKLESAGPTQRL